MVEVAGVKGLQGDVALRQQGVAGLEDDAGAASANAIDDDVLVHEEAVGAGGNLARLKAGEQSFADQVVRQSIFLAIDCGEGAVEFLRVEQSAGENF